MLGPERTRFDREQRSRPTPPEESDQAKINPPRERPKSPEGPEEAKGVLPIEENYKPSMEDIQREIRRLQLQRSAIVKLKAGDNTFRVVPSREGWRFYETIGYHWSVGPRRRGRRCLRDFDEACFLCEKVDGLSQSPDPDAQAEAKAMKRTTRCLVNIIMLDAPEKGVQQLNLPVSAVATLVSYFGDPELRDWLDPEHGRNVKIRRSGEGLLTRYSDPILSPRTSAIPYKDWPREITDLTDVFSRPSYESQQRLYEGIDGGEEVN